MMTIEKYNRLFSVATTPLKNSMTKIIVHETKGNSTLVLGVAVTDDIEKSLDEIIKRYDEIRKSNLKRGI